MVNYLIKDASWGQFKLCSKNDLNQKIEIQFPLIKGGRADVLLWNNHYELWNWKDKKTYVDTSLKTPLIHSPGITIEALEYVITRYPNLHKLKTSNEHADWVKEWVSSGNKIETLIETANTTRPSAWRKMNPVRKKKKSTTAEKSKTNKQPTRKLGA